MQTPSEIADWILKDIKETPDNEFKDKNIKYRIELIIKARDSRFEDEIKELKSRNTIELKPDDALLKISKDMKTTFYLPNQEDDEVVKSNSIVITMLAILIKSQDEELTDLIYKKVEESKQLLNKTGANA